MGRILVYCTMAWRYGSPPALSRRDRRYPWRVWRQRQALSLVCCWREAGKLRLSGTNTVSETVRGRKRTLSTVAHVSNSRKSSRSPSMTRGTGTRAQLVFGEGMAQRSKALGMRLRGHGNVEGRSRAMSKATRAAVEQTPPCITSLEAVQAPLRFPRAGRRCDAGGRL